MKKMINYTAKNQKIYIGLEDSKKTWKLCVRSNGIAIQETSMPAQYKILHSYLKKNYPGCSIKIIYEAGFKGFTLADKLNNDGFHCVVTPAHTVTQEKNNKIKCDKIDARRLAKILENNDYKSCTIPDKELREDRQISRTLIQVQKDITRTKNRIRKLLDFHGYDESFPAGIWYESHYRQLKNHSFPESLQYCIDLHLNMLDHLLGTKKALTKKLKELTKKDRYSETAKTISSAPGIGWFTAIRLVLEWGNDFTRFKTDKSIAAFTGLVCSEYSTGDAIRKGRITGQGNSMIRSWLIEAAWTAYKRDPALLHKFEAVYRHSSSKKKAIVAVARKLVVRLRAMVLNNQPYIIGLAR